MTTEKKIQESQEAPAEIQIEQEAPVETPKKQATTKPQKNEQKENHKAIYDKYIEFKFMTYDGAKLKNEALQELEELEKKVKSFKGNEAKRTVTAAIDKEIIKMEKGISVPDEYVKLIPEKNKKYYF